MQRSMIIGVVAAAVVAAVVGLVVGLALGGGGGVAQSDYDAVKQQLAEQQQKQAKFPDYEKYPVKRGDVSKPILGAIVNAPPRATATPLPAGVPTPTPAPAAVPPAPKTVPLYVHMDTVTSGPGESKFNVEGNLFCVKTSVFTRGMHLVWRMEVVDTSTGKILQGTDVKEATIKLPNGDTVALRYGRHGSGPDAPWYFTAAWDIPLDFPLGALDYSVTVTTQDGKSVTVKDPLVLTLPNFQPGSDLDTRVVIIS